MAIQMFIDKSSDKMNYRILIFNLLICVISCNSKNLDNPSNSINEEDNNLIDSSSYQHNTAISQTGDPPDEDTVTHLSQIVIPFDLNSGVPFFNSDKYGNVIEGFEVDDNENLYFLGGEVGSSTLACYKNENEIFRRSYTEFRSSPLHSYRDTLTILDIHNAESNLFTLNTKDGSIIRNVNSITENRINDHYFQDSLIILNLFNLNEEVSIDSRLIPMAYGLNGTLWGIADSLNTNFSYESWAQDEEYLGTWKGFNVYWSLSGDNYQYYDFILRNPNGDSIKTKSYSSDVFGQSLYGMSGAPREHRKLNNDKIYILCGKGDNAVITILTLKELFTEL